MLHSYLSSAVILLPLLYVSQQASHNLLYNPIFHMPELLLHNSNAHTRHTHETSPQINQFSPQFPHVPSLPSSPPSTLCACTPTPSTPPLLSTATTSRLCSDLLKGFYLLNTSLRLFVFQSALSINSTSLPVSCMLHVCIFFGVWFLVFF